MLFEYLSVGQNKFYEKQAYLAAVIERSLDCIEINDDPDTNITRSISSAGIRGFVIKIQNLAFPG
jgi:hypothetical protein